MAAIPESSRPAGQSASSRGLTRRGVVRAAAWSVPAVTVVSAAPAYANSSGADVVGVEVVNATYVLEGESRVGVDVGFLVGVRPDPTAGTSGEPSPALTFLLTFDGVWQDAEVIFTPVSLDPAQWEIVHDGTTALNADGSVTASTGQLHLLHLGGLLSGGDDMAQAHFRVTGSEGFLPGEINGSFSAALVTPLEEPWVDATPGGSTVTLSYPTSG